MTGLPYRNTLPRLALRQLGNRLACALLTFVFYLSISALMKSERAVQTALLAGALGMPYALFTAFRLAARQGERDYNHIKHGRMQANPLRGLWTGLLAESPAFLLFLFLCATQNVEIYWLPVLINMVTNCHYWWLMALVPSPWMMALSLPLLPAACFAGYIAGLRQWKLPFARKKKDQSKKQHPK